VQEAGDEALAAAVAARQRRPLVRVEADWQGDGGFAHPYSSLTSMVREVEVSRALTSDLPAEAGLVDGYVSAEATLTLEGAHPAGGRAADLFVPYGAGSLLATEQLVARDVHVDLGLATREGPKLLRQFTGPVRSIAADQRTRQVTVEALDPSERLRALVTMPVCAIGGTAWKEDPSGYPWLTNSQWVIDYVLRRNGIYASPPPHPDALFSATLHGSHAAEIAAQTFIPDDDPAVRARYDGDWYTVDGHPFGMLYPRGSWHAADPAVSPGCRHVVDGQVIPTAGMGIGISAWVYCGDGMQEALGTDGPDDFRYLARFQLGPSDRVNMFAWGDGRVGMQYLSAAGDNSSLSVSLNDTGPLGWKFVGLYIDFFEPGRAQFYMRVEGTRWQYTTPPVVNWQDYGELYPRPRAEIVYSVPMTNVSMWVGTEPPSGIWPGEIHIPEASIEPGLNWLTHLPDVAAADSWGVLQDVVGAEFGTLGFDEWGAPFFRSRASVASGTTSIEKTYTTSASIKELAAEVNTDTIRNVVGWESQAAFSDWNPQVAFEAETYYQFNVIPGITDFVIPVPPLVIVPEGYEVPQLTPEQWEAFKDEIVWGYVAFFPTGQGLVPDAEVNIYWSLIAPRTGLLTIENLSPRRFELRLPNDTENNPGEPALRLYGHPVTPEPKTLAERFRPGSMDVYGERGYRLPESPWRQLDSASSTVAASLLANLANPLPIIEDVPVVGDPRVQIGDTVRLRDRDRIEVVGTVVKVTRRLSKSDGLADTIAVRPIAPPGVSLLDSANYLLDDNFILSP
jgi:hypothetical protein